MVIDAKGIQAELVKKAAEAEAGASTEVAESYKNQPKRFPRRAKWIEEQMRIRGWSPQVLSENKGPDRKTIRRIQQGLPVRPMTLDRLADALSEKGKVTCAGIPSD
jgi:hypothetical protein